jgi:hypothetical protein|uniref:Uncharacterized protein n=1 Tax=Ochromonas sp. CCMP1393 TaxID=420556 RepID=A0A0D3MKN1_9STRA|nr:putative protein Ycf19 [Ochromonas sp. CCMP1393]
MLTDSHENMPILAAFFLFLADFITYFHVILKVYRILCFSKITCDQMPLLNPYTWPFSMIRVSTAPYFRFWGKVLPNLKFGNGSYDVSAILGLEMLSGMISVCSYCRSISLQEAQRVILESSS